MAQQRQRVTASILYQEIIALRETLEQHTVQDNANFQELRQLLEGTNGAPGMKIRVDRLEQTEAQRQRHVGYLWTAMTAMAAALVAIVLKAFSLPVE